MAPCCPLLLSVGYGAGLVFVGYATGFVLVGYCGAQVAVAGHSTIGEGARPEHQLLATATSWPLKVPLQRTMRVTFFSSKPHLVGQLTFEVHQNGAQGAVAQHTTSAFGFLLSLQNVSATITPSGWLIEEPTQCTVRDRMLPRMPHSVGHTSELTVQLYVTHSAVAEQFSELAGLSPVHQLSATITTWLFAGSYQYQTPGTQAFTANFLLGKYVSLFFCFSVFILAWFFVRRRLIARVFFGRRSKGNNLAFL